MRETWMDEGVVTYMTNRLLDRKRGKNNMLLEFPSGLNWLPNIHRETFNSYSYPQWLYQQARGDALPQRQCRTCPSSMAIWSICLAGSCYDRGSRVCGDDRRKNGWVREAFFDFWHVIYTKYYFRILRVWPTCNANWKH